MKFNDLQITGKKSNRRVGRGISAGRGKTAGRGTKGQSSRTGYSKKPGFAGGQLPLMQALPKLPGFRSIRVPAENVYTGQLNELKGSVDNFKLADAGLITSPYVKVKIVVKGELTSKVDIATQKISAPALEMIQKAGGSFKEVPQIGRSRLEKNENKGHKAK